MASVQTGGATSHKSKKNTELKSPAEDTAISAEDVADLARSVEEVATEAVAAGETMMTHGLDFYREGLRFVGDRIKQDIELQQNLLDCREPREFYEIQAGFVQNMARQYAEEYQKLMGTAFSAAGEVRSSGNGKAA